MLAQEIIRIKRDGGTLGPGEIGQLALELPCCSGLCVEQQLFWCFHKHQSAYLNRITMGSFRICK